MVDPWTVVWFTFALVAFSLFFGMDGVIMNKLRFAIDGAIAETKLYKRVSRKTVLHLVKCIEEAQSEALDALEQAEEYFNDCADVDIDQEGYVPNKEMRHLVRIQEAIKLL